MNIIHIMIHCVLEGEIASAFNLSRARNAGLNSEFLKLFSAVVTAHFRYFRAWTYQGHVAF